MRMNLKNRFLGNTTIEVSPIAWGMWRFAGDDIREARKRVDAAFAAGITLFDTADIYGPGNKEPFGAAESLLGRIFSEDPSLRSRMVLATKGGIRIGVPYDSSAEYLQNAIDASLKRLRTDHVELWQIHRPDMLTHPQEVAMVVERAHQAGKIAAIGVSNFNLSQTSALARFLTVPLVSLQPEFSPLATQPLFDGLLDHAMMLGLTVLAWSPLGGGRLMKPKDRRTRAVARLLDTKAQETGVDRAAAALSWIMTHPSQPIPIVGTQNPVRIATITDAYKPQWNRKEWYAVLQASLGEKLP